MARAFLLAAATLACAAALAPPKTHVAPVSAGAVSYPNTCGRPCAVADADRTPTQVSAGPVPAALAPPKTHVAPVSAGAVPAAIAAAVPAVAAQPASAAILGIKAPLLGQAGVVFAPVLLVAVPIVLIVIGNGAIQQVKRVLSGEGQKYSQNEN